MMMILFRNSMMAAMAMTLLLGACSKRHQELMVTGDAALLENPYPMNYPSTAPKPNKRIRLLKNEAVILLDERIEKDYLVYKVRTIDGVEGYVLAGPGIKKVDEK